MKATSFLEPRVTNSFLRVKLTLVYALFNYSILVIRSPEQEIGSKKTRVRIMSKMIKFTIFI